METNLKKCNIEVIKAKNGYEAIELVKINLNKVDFIVLDLDMPILNGFEACERIIKLYDKENV